MDNNDFIEIGSGSESGEIDIGDFDELNDETFGAAVEEDWESAHEKLALFETDRNFSDLSKGSQNSNNGARYDHSQLSHPGGNGLSHMNFQNNFAALSLGSTSTPTVETHKPLLMNTTSLPPQFGNPIANLSFPQISVPTDVSWTTARSQQSGINETLSLADLNNSEFNDLYKGFNADFLKSMKYSNREQNQSQNQSRRSLIAATPSVPPQQKPQKVYTLDEIENLCQTKNSQRPSNLNESNATIGNSSIQRESSASTGNSSIQRESPFRAPRQQNYQNRREDWHSQGDFRNQRWNQNAGGRNYQGNFHHRNQFTQQRPQAYQQPIQVPNPLNPLEMIDNPNFNSRNQGVGRMQNNHSQPQQYHHRQQGNNFQQRRNNLPEWARDSTNQDEYANLMTRRDIDWVRRILRMPLEFDDPYLQDYYFVTYQTRKIAAELKKKERDTGKNQVIPTLIVPDRSSKTPAGGKNENRYAPIQFEGSLGKLQVSNVNCPRKLLDFSNKLKRLEEGEEDSVIIPQGRNELNKFRKLLLEIERNYAYILKIDHEDKRMAALPEDAKQSHLAARAELCEQLAQGILTTEDNEHLNFSIASIRKGCMLIFRALQVLQDINVKIRFIADLLQVKNFHFVVMQKDKTLYCLDYGQILVDAIKTIRDCNFELLLKVANSMDDASIIAKFQCGQEIIEVLMAQYQYFQNILPDEKIQWLNFLNRVLEDVDDIPHLRKLCTDHIRIFKK